MKQYKWLLFDADGTLFDFAKAEESALVATYRDLGLAYGSMEIQAYRRINVAAWQAFEKGELSIDQLRSIRFKRLFEEKGVSLDPVSSSDRYIEHLGKGHYLLAGAEKLIKRLTGRYNLALITNGISHVQRPRLAASALANSFNRVVISDEIGPAKPHPAYFDHTFQAMGDPPKEEVLVIGDSLTSDMQGGCDYGVDTCWYNPAGKEKPTHLDITHQVSTLAELENQLI